MGEYDTNLHLHHYHSIIITLIIVLLIVSGWSAVSAHVGSMAILAILEALLVVNDSPVSSPNTTLNATRSGTFKVSANEVSSMTSLSIISNIISLLYFTYTCTHRIVADPDITTKSKLFS